MLLCVLQMREFRKKVKSVFNSNLQFFLIHETFRKCWGTCLVIWVILNTLRLSLLKLYHRKTRIKVHEVLFFIYSFLFNSSTSHSALNLLIMRSSIKYFGCNKFPCTTKQEQIPKCKLKLKTLI